MPALRSKLKPELQVDMPGIQVDMPGLNPQEFSIIYPKPNEVPGGAPDPQ